jgi:hypothetical protein
VSRYPDLRTIKDATLQPVPPARAKKPAAYASTGKIRNADPALGRKVFLERDAQAVEGSATKERQDRQGRAKGGRVGKHKGASVHVILASPAPIAGFGHVDRGIPPPGEGHTVDRHGGREYGPRRRARPI